VSAAVNHAGGMQNMGSKDVANVDRTTPNPQKNEGQSVLVKLVYQPTADQKHTVSAEHVNKDADYELLSSRAKLPLTTASAVAGENATSNMTRDRLSLQSRYTLNNAYVDHVQTAFSFQDASSREFGVTQKYAGRPCARCQLQ
jgi:hemoglobin/transferrin/lactoferrin receptor protein